MRWLRHADMTWQRLTSWIENRPLAAVVSLTAVLSLTIVTIYSLIIQDAFQTYIWPWLETSSRVLNLLILLVISGVITLFLRLNHEVSEASKYRALATHSSAEATRSRLGHAEDQLRHALRNLNVSLNVVRMISDAFTLTNADPTLIDQISMPPMKLVIESAQQLYAHNASRGSIWAPDPANPEYLKVIQNVNLDEKTAQTGRFYIGKDPQKKALQGVAGKVYRDNKGRVRHVNPVTHISPDAKEYIKLDEKQRVVMYESFATVPIMHAKRCLGVLCLDSPNPDCFGKDGDLVVLTPITELLGELLRLREIANELAARAEASGETPGETPAIG